MSEPSFVEVVKSPRATQKLAAKLASELPLGTVLALSGELGAGKTTFVQGLAEGMGVFDRTQVLSPTYTLMNEYPGARGTLIHIDLYRLSETASAWALGLDEAIGRADAITAIEWATRLPELLPPNTVWVELSHVGGRQRRIEVRGAPAP